MSTPQTTRLGAGRLGKRTQETLLKLTDFNAVRISVASPEKMLSWSYG